MRTFIECNAIAHGFPFALRISAPDSLRTSIREGIAVDLFFTMTSFFS